MHQVPTKGGLSMESNMFKQNWHICDGYLSIQITLLIACGFVMYPLIQMVDISRPINMTLSMKQPLVIIMQIVKIGR